MFVYLIYMFHFKIIFSEKLSWLWGTAGVGLLWDGDELGATMTPALQAGQWCSHRLQSHGTLSGAVVATSPNDHPRQSKTRSQVHSPAMKISQKWQESELEAGVEIRLHMSSVQGPSKKPSQKGRTVGSRTRHMCTYCITQAKWGCPDLSLNGPPDPQTDPRWGWSAQIWPFGAPWNLIVFIPTYWNKK